jgi:fatty acid desaturase
MTSTQREEVVLAKALMKYTGKVAVPTVLLFIIAFSGFLFFMFSGYLNWISYWVIVPMNTIFIYLLFTPLHEASHQNIKGRKTSLRWLENIIGWISGSALLAPFPMFKNLHLVHHGHTNDPEKDPDYWVAAKNPLLIVFKCMTIYFDYIYHYVSSLNSLWKTSEGKRNVVYTVTGYVLLISIIVLLGASFGWKVIILGWIIPAYFALGILSFAFDWLPHHPHSIQKKYLDTRIILSPILNILLVSQNLHLIHHLYSGIPYYHYQNAYEVLKDKLKKEGANIEN